MKDIFSIIILAVSFCFLSLPVHGQIAEESGNAVGTAPAGTSELDLAVEAALDAATPRPNNEVEVSLEPPAGPELESQVYQLKFLYPSDIADKVRQMMGVSPGGVIVDEQARQLEVTAPRETIDKITALIAGLDKERGIVIDVRPVSVDLDDEHSNGVKWEAIVSGHKYFVARDDSRKFSVGTISKEDYAVLMEALETVGQTRDFAAVSASLRNGEGTDIRLKAFGPDVSVTAAPLRSASTGEQEPQDRYSARLLTGVTAVGDTEVDIKITLAEGDPLSVRVPAGHVVVIGGIFTLTKMESTTKFPVLGDLPLVGVIFRGQNKVFHRLENILFLTPRVVPGPEK